MNEKAGQLDSLYSDATNLISNIDDREEADSYFEELDWCVDPAVDTCQQIVRLNELLDKLDDIR